MFFPIGDEPNPRGRAWVTYGIIAANVLIYVLLSLPLTMQRPDLNDPATLEYARYLAQESGVSAHVLLQQLSAYDIFVFTHGFKPAEPGWIDLFVSLFLHAGWMHLLGNMLFLWIFGDNVEARLGHVGYALTYLATGLSATLFFAAVQWHSLTPLVGASGAISGVLGCYFLWFPQNRVRVVMILLWFIDVLHIPARWVLGFYILIENVLPFFFHEGTGGVAYGAHIGGFLGGLAIGAAVQRWPWGRDDKGGSEPVFGADIHGTLHVADYLHMTPGQREQVHVEDVFTLADDLTDSRHFDDALAVLQRFIATHPYSEDLARAHLRAGFIQWRGLHRPTAAYQHFLAVLDLNPSADVAEVARRSVRELEA